MALSSGFTKVRLSRVYDDDTMHRGVYGEFNSESCKRDYIPYCTLKSAIGQFYYLELNRFLEKQKMVFTQAKEDVYRKKVTDLSLTVLRFTVAATLGESRHFGRHALAPHSSYIDVKRFKGYKEKYKRASQYMKTMLGGVGFYGAPSSRDIIYRAFVPEYLWLRYLTNLRSIYYDVDWASGMGGSKWGAGCVQGLRLYKAVSGGTFEDMAIQFDTLVNHFHNGGLLLNKFACGNCLSLKSLLDLKQQGRMLQVQKCIETTPCDRWNEGDCDHALRTRPINNGGNNGKEEEALDEYKGVYSIYVQEIGKKGVKGKGKELQEVGYGESCSTVSVSQFIEGTASTSSS